MAKYVNLARAKAFVSKAAECLGIPYKFGAEASPREAHPKALDCSELVEWASYNTPGMVHLPDGSYNQAASKHVKRCTAYEALHTVGAVLFISKTGKPGGVNHVGISRGDGSTIEANGYYRKVRIRPAEDNEGYWTFGGLIEGLHW